MRLQTLPWAARRLARSRWLLVALACAIGTLAQTGRAWADPGDSIVFVRDQALWHMPADGSSAAVELATLAGQAGPVTRLAASPRGDAVLVEMGAQVAWVPLTATGRGSGLRPLDCQAPARFSPDGKHVACTGPGAQLALYALPGERRSVMLDMPAVRALGFVDASRVAVADEAGIWAVPMQQREQRLLVAPHRPSGVLLIGPRGRRAVGVYPPLESHKSPGLYVFRLDGKGTRRRLLPEAEPVAWSQDERWVAVQDEKSACLVRATGGQYKCWKHYHALSLSPDGNHVLLAKSPEDETDTHGSGRVDLYRGEGDGVRPVAPRLLQRGVTGPAVWVPACAAGCR
jgi:dipeptidyl aminopeptidase/acylaminoacyl peptidase